MKRITTQLRLKAECLVGLILSRFPMKPAPRFESAKTPNGNIGVSYASQVKADQQAQAMDAAHVTNCTGCDECSYWANGTHVSECKKCGS